VQTGCAVRATGFGGADYRLLREKEVTSHARRKRAYMSLSPEFVFDPDMADLVGIRK
jgi:hypothetical protein